MPHETRENLGPRSEKPSAPDLPDYLLDPVDRQQPAQLDALAEYATRLASWKREKRELERETRRAEDSISDEQRAALADRDVSTDPEDYDDVPSSGAYITVKTTKQTADCSYEYYYWQWREGDTWKNEYIAPVDPSAGGS